MTSPARSRASWSERVTDQIVESVAHYQGIRKVSTQELANRCTELGWPVKRASLSGLLTQRSRQSITVQELTVLARALEVPPVALLFPVHAGGRVEVLDGVEVDTMVAAEWWSGSPDAPWMTSALGERRATDRAAWGVQQRYFSAVAAFQRANRDLAIAGHEALQHDDAGSDGRRPGEWLDHQGRAAWRALEALEQRRREVVEAGLPEPGLPPGLDVRSLAQLATLPVVAAVEAIPGAQVAWPLVLVTRDGEQRSSDGPA